MIRFIKIFMPEIKCIPNHSGGPDENRTRRRCIASASRPLGTCGPILLAEDVGFEPTWHLAGPSAFETAPLSLSGNLPCSYSVVLPASRAKVSYATHCVKSDAICFARSMLVLMPGCRGSTGVTSIQCGIIFIQSACGGLTPQ